LEPINKIILGTVQFGLNYGINNKTGKPNRASVFEILNLAYDSGVRLLDTAEVYGNAHELIGDFHRHHPSKKFQVISKVPHEFDGNFDIKIDQYLKELDITELKALLFHSYESYKKNISLFSWDSKFADFMENVDSIGVSIYTNEQFSEVIEDDKVNIIQLPFNLFDNNNLRGHLIEKAKQKGKTIHTRSAFLQGLFFVEQDNSITRTLQKELHLIKEIAKELNINVSRLALSYCLQQKNIDNVIIGVETIEQFEQNISEGYTEIPVNYLEKINSIFIKNRDILNPSTWN
jgi:aryl-alcohol dehydrogenase-like predicted oxidoreductase